MRKNLLLIWMFQHVQVNIHHLFCTASVKKAPHLLQLLLLLLVTLSNSIVLFATKANRVINYFPSAGPSRNTWSIPPHHICHSPQWNTLPTHKTNHPGSTYTLFLPLKTLRGRSHLPSQPLIPTWQISSHCGLVMKIWFWWHQQRLMKLFFWKTTLQHKNIHTLASDKPSSGCLNYDYRPSKEEVMLL